MNIFQLFQKWTVVSTMLKAALLVLKEMGRLGAMEIVIGLRGHVLKVTLLLMKFLSNIF